MNPLVSCYLKKVISRILGVDFYLLTDYSRLNFWSVYFCLKVPIKKENKIVAFRVSKNDILIDYLLKAKAIRLMSINFFIFFDPIEEVGPNLNS